MSGRNTIKAISNSVFHLSQSNLAAAAEEAGLEVFAQLDAAAAELALKYSAEKLRAWQESGYAAEMGYMRRPISLFTELRNFLPSARSCLLFTVPYYSPSSKLPQLPLAKNRGRVARYAWGRDYHEVLRDRLKNFVKTIAKELPRDFALEYRVFSDAVPLLERTLAAASGLGAIGKNSLLLRPGAGSYHFICEILWNIPLEPSALDLPLEKELAAGASCGSCKRCISDCPTTAIVAPGQIDSRRCISYLTIEKKTAFTEWEAKAIGQWIFGCDICQEVCPFNHAAVQTKTLPEFQESQGVGHSLELAEVLDIADKSQFKQRFSGTALMRADRDRLVRNACAVVANSRVYSLIPALEKLAQGDPGEIVRIEAKRSLERLGIPS